MKNLTKTDLAIIGMYLAHAPLRFEPENCKSILLSVAGKFLIGDTLVIGYNDEDGITRSEGLSHPKSDIYPVLRRFEDLPKNLQKKFSGIVAKAKVNMLPADEAFGEAATFFFKERIDICNLIGQGKAIHYKNSKWWNAMEKGKTTKQKK